MITSPFHERTSALNETGLWSHWAGHLAANRYQESDKFEYFAVRNSAGIFDSSGGMKTELIGEIAGYLLKPVRERDLLHRGELLQRVDLSQAEVIARHYAAAVESAPSPWR